MFLLFTRAIRLICIFHVVFDEDWLQTSLALWDTAPGRAFVISIKYNSFISVLMLSMLELYVLLLHSTFVHRLLTLFIDYVRSFDIFRLHLE